MFIIFRSDVTTTRFKHVFDIESFIQDISIEKQVYMNWDTDSFIYVFYFVQINQYIYIYI